MLWTFLLCKFLSVGLCVPCGVWIIAQIEVILTRLATVETQQRYQTQLLQAVLAAVEKNESISGGALPDGVKLPLIDLQDLFQFEEKLESGEFMKSMVGKYYRTEQHCFL